MDNSSTSSHLHPYMSIKDKVRIANSLFKPLMRKAEYKMDVKLNIKRLAKTARFPFFFIQEVETQEHGKWTVILTIPDKPKPKGYQLMFDAFQPYVIDYAKNPENNGIGFFMITACGTEVRLDEWTPHLINRMIQRSDLSIMDMTIKNVCLYLRKYIHDTLMSVKQVTHKTKNGELLNEFVQSVPDGQFLGLITENSDYRCCKTFISSNEMKDSQFVHNEILREIALMKYKTSGSFDVDMEPINVKLEEKYGEATFADIATLLNGTDKKVWFSENIKKLAESKKHL